MAPGERRGRVRIRTASELSSALAIPVYYILIGRCQVAFPESTVGNPSRFVSVIPIRNVKAGEIDLNQKFPVYVNWRQWNQVIVPILTNPMYPGRIGSLGATTGTGDSYTEDGTLVESSPRDLPTVVLGPGVLSYSEETIFLQQIVDAIYAAAVEAGY